MSEQIASITLRADVSDLKTANTELDKLAGTAAGAAAGADKLADSAKRIKPGVQQGTEGLKEQQNALKGLLENIDPVTKALNRLDEQQASLRGFQTKGFLDNDDFQTYNKILEDTRLKLTDTGEAAARLQAELAATQAAEKQSAALKQLVANIDPTIGKLQLLDERFQELQGHLSAGRISSEQFEHLSGILIQTEQRLTDTGEAAARMQAELVATQAAERQSVALKGLLGSIDPTIRAFNMLDEQYSQLVSHFESGRINGAQFEHFNSILNETRQRLTTVADVLPEALSKQELAAKRAGISVGQYNAALRMLPAQFTDIATQLAGGQSPFMILLQQGGQIKDSFGGFGAMFQALRDALFGINTDIQKGTDETSESVGDLADGFNNASEAAENLGRARGLLTPFSIMLTGIAAAAGLAAYSFYKSNSLLSDFNKTLVLSGNSAGLTADRMLAVSKSAAAAGMTFTAAAETLNALVKSGVATGANFEALTVSITNFADKSNVAVDDLAKAFGRLTADPTKGLIAMAQQFHNVSAEQVEYVAQLQRSGDAAGALNAANEAATQGFDKQTRNIEANMGTLQRWASATGDAFKGMWDGLLDIGRPNTGQEMLAIAQQQFDVASQNLQTAKDSGFSEGRLSRYQNLLDHARAELEMAQQRTDVQALETQGAEKQAAIQREQLRYTEESSAAYKRSLSPLETLTQKQKELNKALKEGSVLPNDFAILMKDAQKTYDATLKKPQKTPAVQIPSGDRTLINYKAQGVILDDTLAKLKESGKVQERNGEFSKVHAHFTELAVYAQNHLLSAQEKSQLANKDAVEAAATLVDQKNAEIEAQKKLNQLRLEQARGAGDAQYIRDTNGLGSRAKQEADQVKALRQQYRDAFGDVLSPEQLAQLNSGIEQVHQNLVAAHEAHKDWGAGITSGFADWIDQAEDLKGQTHDLITNGLSGMISSLTETLNGSQAGWKAWGTTILKTIEKIILQLTVASALKAAVDGMSGSSTGWVASLGGFLKSGMEANAKGGVYNSPGLSSFSGQIVSKPTMFAFAHGAGLMGEAGPEAIMPLTRDSAGRLGVRTQGGGAGGMALSINTTINIDANGNASSSTSAGGDAMGRALAKQINDQARMVVLRETAPNGIIFNYTNKR